MRHLSHKARRLLFKLIIVVLIRIVPIVPSQVPRVLQTSATFHVRKLKLNQTNILELELTLPIMLDINILSHPVET